MSGSVFSVLKRTQENQDGDASGDISEDGGSFRWRSVDSDLNVEEGNQPSSSLCVPRLSGDAEYDSDSSR